MASFVGKFEEMNPETEFLITGGHFLQNGMEILTSDSSIRFGVEKAKEIGGWDYHRLLELNRWCKVSNLRYDAEYKLYRFIGTYEDGTQRLRSSENHQGWLVKFDSIDVLQQRRNAVMELVAKAMLAQDSATYHGESSGKDVSELPAKTADEILALFGMGVQK